MPSSSRAARLWPGLAALLLGVLTVALSASTITATSTETEVLNLINQARAARGLTPLTWQDNLATAARAHSQDMAGHAFCSHTGSDGSNPGARVTRAGYLAANWGETVGCGQRTPAEVVDAWMNSPGHRVILLGAYQYAGAAFATGGGMHEYWTVEVGAGPDEPAGSLAAAPAPDRVAAQSNN